MSRVRISRRDFLKSAAATTIGVPFIVPSSALGGAGAVTPSNRITMGCIGVGGQGIWNMKAFLSKSDVQVVAVCDVNENSDYSDYYYGGAAGREPARQIVQSYYAADKPAGTYRGCAVYNDFRELLAREDIDAVLIATPDHWHVLISIAAAKAGKDIYCEKPLSRTIEQGRVLCETIKRYGRVFQTGSQLRSTRNVRFACELVRNGRIGRLHTIRTFLPAGGAIGPQPVMSVPKGFDYDMWVGPAPWQPYTEERCHVNYRYISDYAGGQLTDFGAHDNDIAQWGNGTELTGPVEIQGRGEFPQDGLWDTATTFKLYYKYANGVRLICSTEQYPSGTGVRFEADEGWVYVRGNIDAEPSSILTSKIRPDEVHLYHSDNHHRNFLDCVKSRKETIAPAEVGHRSVTICHLGNIAMKLGRKLQWDPEKERFVNDEEANRMLSCAMRGPWRL